MLSTYLPILELYIYRERGLFSFPHTNKLTQQCKILVHAPKVLFHIPQRRIELIILLKDISLLKPTSMHSTYFRL